MRVVLLILVTLFLAACEGENGGSDDNRREDLSLQTYEVPSEIGEEIRNSVSFLFTAKGWQVGRARLIGSDKIAVLAPEAFHSDIEELIREAVDSFAGEPPRIKFRYWLVKIEPAETMEISKSLEKIESALQGISENIGPASYLRLDYAEHVVRSGAQARIRGPLLGGSVQPVARGGMVTADLKLDVTTGENIGTDITIKNDEILVLALVGGSRDEASESFKAFVVQAHTF